MVLVWQPFWLKTKNNMPKHTVVIWTFTFHKKTRLYVVNLEGQFQTSLEAKLINLLIWKFRSIILIFLLLLAGIVKSSAFCTLSMVFKKGWNVWVTFLCQIAMHVIQLSWKHFLHGVPFHGRFWPSKWTLLLHCSKLKK